MHYGSALTDDMRAKKMRIRFMVINADYSFHYVQSSQCKKIDGLACHVRLCLLYGQDLALGRLLGTADF